MPLTTEVLQAVTLALLGVVGFFMKQTLGKVDRIETKVNDLGERTACIEGKLDLK